MVFLFFFVLNNLVQLGDVNNIETAHILKILYSMFKPCFRLRGIKTF